MGTKNYSSYSDLITFSRASTGTYLDSDGLLKSAATNSPRVEYDYQGNRLGLLVEEARTNYARNSTLFTGSGWSLIDAAVSAGFSAPDGSTDAHKFIPSSSATVNARLFQGTATIPAGSVTGSFYAKAGELNSILLCGYTGSGYQSAYFNLETGQVIGTFGGPDDYSITQITDDGWFRVSVTITNVSNYHINISAGMDDDFFNSTSVQNGANWNSVNGIYIYGAQVEAGTFPTSYIPTSGATATRSADVASIGVGAFGYNKGAGSLVVETLTETVKQFLAGPAYFNTTGFLNSRGFSKSNVARTASGDRYMFTSYDGTSTAFDLADANTGQSVKLGAAWKDAENAVADGGTVQTGTIRNPAPTDLRIGGRDNGLQSRCYISSIAYYPRRLSNAQLVELTS